MSDNTSPAETERRVTEKARRKGRAAIAKKNRVLQRLHVEYVPINEIRPNDYNPNRQDDHDFELLLKSMEEDGFCVAASTPILCADLVWRPAGQLQVGQEIVAFNVDKEPGNAKHLRKFRTAKVESNGLFEDELFAVQLEDGEVLCNADHPWLATRKHGPMDERFNGEWRKTSELRLGDEVTKILDTWEVEDGYDAGWLAGFLDGEGCVSAEKPHNGSAVKIARLTVSQKPGTTARAMVDAITSRCPDAEVKTWVHADRPNWQDNVRVRVNKLNEIMALLGSIRPQRLLENAGAFWEGRSIAGAGKSGRKVVSVTGRGRGTLAAIATSTKTYIAAGYAMHNTQPIVVLADGTIVDGEHRWRAARSLGLEEVPVVKTDMSPEQMRIATLRHNRARGSEDVQLTAEVLRDLQELGAIDWAQDSLMMDDSELNSLLEEISAPEVLAGEDWQEAWVPGGRGTDGVDAQELSSSLGNTQLGAGTEGSMDVRRERERRLAQARSEQERQAAIRDTATVQIILSFSADEAKLVRSVLGERPAERLLAICKEMA